MKKKKNISTEFILGIIIASLLISVLLFETIYAIIPNYVIVSLFLFYVLVKVAHIIKVGGTIFEDYLSLFTILILGFLRYITIDRSIHFTVLSVSIVVILYSVGLMPSIDKISKSKTLFSFLASYILFVIIIILLFAGTYSANSSLFTENDNSATLSFKDSLYFSIMTFTTVGYGDIAPLGVNRLISSLEAIMGIALNIAFMGYILASKRFK